MTFPPAHLYRDTTFSVVMETIVHPPASRRNRRDGSYPAFLTEKVPVTRPSHARHTAAAPPSSRRRERLRRCPCNACNSLVTASPAFLIEKVWSL